MGLLVQRSAVALYPLNDVATCVSVAPKIRSFPKIFRGTFENAAPGHTAGAEEVLNVLLLHEEEARTDLVLVGHHPDTFILLKLSACDNYNNIITDSKLCLECFDTVGWASGRGAGP